MCESCNLFPKYCNIQIIKASHLCFLRTCVRGNQSESILMIKAKKNNTSIQENESEKHQAGNYI